MYADPQTQGWFNAISFALVSFNPIAIAGVIPLLFTAVTSAPFVARVYLDVAAPSARSSRQALMTYVENVKRDALLEFVTIRWYGGRKTTVLRLGELRAMQPRRWGRFANIRREKLDASGRIVKERLQRGAAPWRRLIARLDEPRNKFYVDMRNDRGSKLSDAPGVWASVWRQIQKQSQDVKR